MASDLAYEGRSHSRNSVTSEYLQLALNQRDDRISVLAKRVAELEAQISYREALESPVTQAADAPRPLSRVQEIRRFLSLRR